MADAVKDLPCCHLSSTIVEGAELVDRVLMGPMGKAPQHCFCVHGLRQPPLGVGRGESFFDGPSQSSGFNSFDQRGQSCPASLITDVDPTRPVLQRLAVLQRLIKQLGEVIK